METLEIVKACAFAMVHCIKLQSMGFVGQLNVCMTYTCFGRHHVHFVSALLCFSFRFLPDFNARFFTACGPSTSNSVVSFL